MEKSGSTKVTELTTRMTNAVRELLECGMALGSCGGITSTSSSPERNAIDKLEETARSLEKVGEGLEKSMAQLTDVLNRMPTMGAAPTAIMPPILPPVEKEKEKEEKPELSILKELRAFPVLEAMDVEIELFWKKADLDTYWINTRGRGKGSRQPHFYGVSTMRQSLLCGKIGIRPLCRIGDGELFDLATKQEVGTDEEKITRFLVAQDSRGRLDQDALRYIIQRLYGGLWTPRDVAIPTLLPLIKAYHQQGLSPLLLAEVRGCTTPEAEANALNALLANISGKDDHVTDSLPAPYEVKVLMLANRYLTAAAKRTKASTQ